MMNPLISWIGAAILSPSLLLSAQEPAPPSSENESAEASSNAGAETTAEAEATPEHHALDTQLRKAAARVIGAGVTLYNDHRDAAGCYRLYQGALIGFEPLVSHHPELQAAIGAGLAQAAELASSDVARAAFELRALLDQTYEVARHGSTSVPPLWERLGGENAVRAVVHEFVALAAGDEEVDFFRDGRYELTPEQVVELEQKLVEFISSATGGPLEYTGKPMGPAHENMGITIEEFNALAADLVAVLRKYEVPQAEIDELLAIIATTQDEIVEQP